LVVDATRDVSASVPLAALAQGVLEQQGLITEQGYAEQEASYNIMAQAVVWLRMLPVRLRRATP
jgi:hypothetical protein